MRIRAATADARAFCVRLVLRWFLVGVGAGIVTCVRRIRRLGGWHRFCTRLKSASCRIKRTSSCKLCCLCFRYPTLLLLAWMHRIAMPAHRSPPLLDSSSNPTAQSLPTIFLRKRTTVERTDAHYMCEGLLATPAEVPEHGQLSANRFHRGRTNVNPRSCC